VTVVLCIGMPIDAMASLAAILDKASVQEQLSRFREGESAVLIAFH
jgi:hypothetical protein